MTSQGYTFSRDRMYDSEGVLVAKRNYSGQYIDKRDNVRATQSFLDDLNGNPTCVRPTAYDDYSLEAGQLSASVPGRGPPSNTQKRHVTGNLQYPDGLPYDRTIVRPQSSTGYAATPVVPRGDGYQQCQIPYRHNSTIRNQYLEYKESDASMETHKQRYVGEANRLKGVPKDRAVGGSVEGFLYDQDGHRTLAPLAAAHDRAGLVTATKRLAHTSDHYGRLPREGHDGHFQRAAACATEAGRGTPAQRARFHDHYSRDPAKHDSDDDTPLAELSPADRRRREKRRDIEWHLQKNSWEISNSEWEVMQREQLQKQNQDREFYEANKVMNRGPLLPNGKYEWLSFGGGYRRVWSDKAGDYVDPPRRLVAPQNRR